MPDSPRQLRLPHLFDQVVFVWPCAGCATPTRVSRTTHKTLQSDPTALVWCDGCLTPDPQHTPALRRVA